MRLKLLPLLFVCSPFLPSAAKADTVLLNNGVQYEGKVIYEDDKYCLLEFEVSKGIKDERKFLKTDIKSITKSSPDVEEFKRLMDLYPTPDLMSIADYEQKIKTVYAFIRNHPKSPKIAEAKKILATLEAELKVIRQGGIKFQGQLVSGEAYLSSAYTYDQSITIQKINNEISSGNLLTALRLYSEFESTFPDSEFREDLIPKIRSVLNSYKKDLQESLSTFDARMKKQEIDLLGMAPEESKRAELAIKEQTQRLKLRFDQERAARIPWISPDGNLKESLSEALRQVESELKRLSVPQTLPSPGASLSDIYRECWMRLPNSTLEEQKVIFERLQKENMPEKYINLLKKRSSNN